VSARTFHIGNDRQKLMRVLVLLGSFLVQAKDDWEIEIRPRRKEKSHEQRKMWHAILEEFGRAVGYTLPEIKQVMKEEFFGVEVKTLPDGKQYRVTQSSEDAERMRYSELIDFTLRRAAENGVLIEDRRAA
jgi:hypothetical protein